MQGSDLQRFITAQDPVYAQALSELAQGAKRSHWMWFIFPQMRGLGGSSMAQFYGVASRAEASSYLSHPVLGARLVECTNLVNAVRGKSALEIFGSPDDVKFRSSMTLFDAVATQQTMFRQALQIYFEGERDSATLALITDSISDPRAYKR